MLPNELITTRASPSRCLFNDNRLDRESVAMFRERANYRIPPALKAPRTHK